MSIVIIGVVLLGSAFVDINGSMSRFHYAANYIPLDRKKNIELGLENEDDFPKGLIHQELLSKQYK